jgi:protein tyrosine phosphatase (PTP) superfamily phosphohydrolase (DUF442 family)
VTRITCFVGVGTLAALAPILTLVCFTIVSSDAVASARECPPLASQGGATSGPGRGIPVGTVESEQGQDLSSCPQAFPGLGNFAEVDRGRLYRSAQPTREGLQLARSRFGIRTVISFRTFHSDRSEAEALGLQYYRIPFNAWHVTPEDAVRFLKIVTDPGNYPILVHCQHGADRTGTMVAVYRIFIQGWRTEEAIDELPRFGFHTIWANLKSFLRDEDWRRAAEQAGILRDGLQ